jgi:N-acetylmuramic acid 6-phosphate etherase
MKKTDKKEFDKKALFEQLKTLATEQRNPASTDIDSKSIPEILEIINNEDKKVPLAVEKELPFIAKAVEAVVAAFKKGGRLIYFGAGTSGRLGILDASECPPTYGVPFDMVQGLIAGGDSAIRKAVEGAEDHEENGANDVTKVRVNSNDVVCGVAASKRTPYVIGAVKKAKELGATTIFVTCIPHENFDVPSVDIPICAHVGPEVVMGSTRMKSGTAQKLVLNMITTASMIRLGKVYENMMIDLQMTNKKLVERSKRVVMQVTDVDYDTAEKNLEEAGGHVKTALVMILANVNADEAKERLKKADGFVRYAIKG